MTAARSLVYALFSELTASPFDQRGLATPRVWRTLPGLTARICGHLPYPLDVGPLVRSLRGALRGDRDEALRAYSALFEVGSKGPPVPIREDFTRLDALNVLEEIVRFYDYFGYRLDEQRAWLAGHLSVELEFLQLLAYQESVATDKRSFQLAQRDFLERHLLGWYPKLLAGLRQADPPAVWRDLFEAVAVFLDRDYEWRVRTLVPEEVS